MRAFSTDLDLNTVVNLRCKPNTQTKERKSPPSCCRAQDRKQKASSAYLLVFTVRFGRPEMMDGGAADAGDDGQGIDGRARGMDRGSS